MNTDSAEQIAMANFDAHSKNSYPGCGIIAGLNQTGKYLVQVCWVKGGEGNSQELVFKADSDTGRLYTAARDPAMEDTTLVIYNAMLERGYSYGNLDFVVSNGNQTDTVIQSTGPLCLDRVLSGRSYEHDINSTQRITAVHSLSKNLPLLQMSILRKSILGEACERLLLVKDELYPGFGHYITTHVRDGDPLQPFLLMSLEGNMTDIAETYWDAIDKKNRVSLAVKWIEIANGRSDIFIINK